MRINSYGRLAMVATTNRDVAVKQVKKTEFMSVMELQEVSRKDSSSANLLPKIPKTQQKSDIDFNVLLDAILKSGDLK